MLNINGYRLLIWLLFSPVLFSAGTAFSAQLDSNEVLRVQFDVPTAYFGNPKADMLNFKLPLSDSLSLIYDPNVTITAKLFNGTKLLGTDTITGGQWPYVPAGAWIPVRFYSNSENWPRFPWEPQVPFSSISDRSIKGRIELSISHGPLNYQSPSLGVNSDTVEIFHGSAGYDGSASFSEISGGGVRILSVQELSSPLPLIPIVNAPVIGHADSAPLVPGKPLVVITHGWEWCGLNLTCPAVLPAWANDMASSISATGSNTFSWLWSGAFSNNLVEARANVENAGIELGKYLLTLGNDALSHLHLIGHSLGTLVNAYAVNFLHQHNIPVEQVTILDSPFGNVLGANLDEPIFRDQMPLGSVTWVDNYYGNGLTARGGPLGDLVKVQNQLIYGAGHEDVHNWYQCSIDGFVPSAPGYQCPNTSGLGFHMSANSHPAYTGWDPGISPPLNGVEIAIDTTNWLLKNCAIALGTATCTEGSPAYLWNESLTIPKDAQYLRFDFRWDKKGDGDYLSLNFGDQLLFDFLGTSFYGSDFMSSGLIPIGQFAGMTDQFLFMLNSTGESNSQFDIRNLEFITGDVPEPGALTLFVIGLGLLLRRHWSSSYQTYNFWRRFEGLMKKVK